MCPIEYMLFEIILNKNLCWRSEFVTHTHTRFGMIRKGFWKRSVLNSSIYLQDQFIQTQYRKSTPYFVNNFNLVWFSLRATSLTSPPKNSHILLTDFGEHIYNYYNALCLPQKISLRHFLQNPNQLTFWVTDFDKHQNNFNCSNIRVFLRAFHSP
jgi:hypothetical protein